jgi:hypothetical protein
MSLPLLLEITKLSPSTLPNFKTGTLFLSAMSFTEGKFLGEQEMMIRD